MVKLGILTSSRADFGVYEPLLKDFNADNEIIYEIIAFGTHLSNLHGHTIDDIFKEGFKVKYSIPTILASDSEESISTSAALTSLKFSSFWAIYKNDFDFIFCLGDRFEMFSAVIAGVPFGIKFIHLYGGDFSKGAIDDVYRNAMTHASILHFTSTQKCAERVLSMTGNSDRIEVVGILSLNNLDGYKLLSIDEFKNEWNINLAQPTILVTFHPETINSELNQDYAQIIKKTLSDLQNKYQLVITMPNADTNGTLYREMYYEIKSTYSNRIYLIENFGARSYFSCMQYSVMMLGNTSSGISESASFGKYFINVGNRQMGRENGINIINVNFDVLKIINAVNDVSKLGEYKGENIYRQKDANYKIINKIKHLLD